MPQAVSADMLEGGIGGRVRPKSGKRTRLTWIDTAPPTGVTVPLRGRPVGALAEYGLNSESDGDESDEQDGPGNQAVANPGPQIEIARTMSTLFDVRKHPAAEARGSPQVKPKAQAAPPIQQPEPEVITKDDPRANLSAVVIPPLDMGRVEGGGGAAAPSIGSDAESEDSPESPAPAGGNHLTAASTWAHPQAEKAAADKDESPGDSLDGDVDEPDDVDVLPTSPADLPSGILAARPSSAPEGANRGEELPSLLELLDDPPGEAGGDVAAASAGGAKPGSETLEDFYPAPRAGDAKAGAAADQSKVRGRLSESIEDGKNISGRSGGFVGNALFRHTPAAQRIQQQQEDAVENQPDAAVDRTAVTGQAAVDKVQQEQAMVAQYKAFRQQQQRAAQQQQQAQAQQQQAQQQQAQQQTRTGNSRNGFFAGQEPQQTETASASMRSRLERPTSPANSVGVANGMQHRRGSALDRRPSSAAERSRGGSPGGVRNTGSALSVGGRAAPVSTLSSVKALYGQAGRQQGLSVSASFSGSTSGVAAQRSAPVLRNSWEGPSSTSGEADDVAQPVAGGQPRVGSAGARGMAQRQVRLAHINAC